MMTPPPEDTDLLAVATDPNIDEGTLSDLLHRAFSATLAGTTRTVDSARLRDALADNPMCPEEMRVDLTVLEHINDANSPVADADLLDYLAVSPSDLVRIAVAKNPLAAAATLSRLCIDPSPVIRYAAGTNPSCPSDGLHQVMALAESVHLGYRDFLYALADHAHATSALLQPLLDGPDKALAARAAGNPNLDTDTLNVLLADPHTPASILTAAQLNPNNAYSLAMLENTIEEALEAFRHLVAHGVPPMDAAGFIKVTIDMDGPYEADQ